MVFNELCGEAGDVCENIVADGLPYFRYLYEMHSAYHVGGNSGSLAVSS